MTQELSRRKVLGLAARAAGAAVAAVPGANWIFAIDGKGAIVKAAVKDGGDPWTPLSLSTDQAEALAAVAETIIPRTDTAGARDARVHEFIDLELTRASEGAKTRFIDGLDWLDKRCKKQYNQGLAKASDADRNQLIHSISDVHNTHADDLATGVRFFNDVKRRTIFAYYTSKEGRVEELGLPRGPLMGKWKGCTHEGGHG